MSTSLLIIEDHPLVRFGMTSVLQTDPQYHIVGEAEDLKTATALFQQEQPDVVTLDLSLRDGNAINLIRAFRARNEAVSLLVVSMHDEQVYEDRCIRLGANGFLSKDLAPSQLLFALDEIQSGKIYRSAEHLSALQKDRSRENGTPEGVLSNREIEVFFMMGKGLSTKRIADHLHLSPKTVDTHREHIKRKLGVFENTELIQRAVKWVMRESMV